MFIHNDICSLDRLARILSRFVLSFLYVASSGMLKFRFLSLCFSLFPMDFFQFLMCLLLVSGLVDFLVTIFPFLEVSKLRMRVVLFFGFFL